MMHRHDSYRRNSALMPKCKTQRAVIADIPLSADEQLTFHEIVTEVKKADFEGTFKQGKLLVAVDDSIDYHLERMMKEGTVKKGTTRGVG